MNLILQILICIAFVVGINGAWLKQPASISNDAVELTQLMKKFWSLKPAIMMQTEPLVYCQVMDECCEDKHREEAMPLMPRYMWIDKQDDFVKIMRMCMNSSTSNKANQLCRSAGLSIVSFETFRDNSDVGKYFGLIGRYEKELEQFFDLFPISCGNEEYHAFICLSNTKLVERCINKILQKIYDDNYKNYQKNMNNVKKILNTFNQQLSEAVTKDTKTE